MSRGANGLAVDGLTKTYGDLTAVDDVSFSVETGELLCLLGPSGCGKSTTLRMIAGLEKPTQGDVMIDDNVVTKQPAHRRTSSMVFQDWALFPYKSVLENVAFGPKMSGVSRQERRDIARNFLRTVEMEEYADQPVMELSGGQKQRVALARSLAMDPDVLLLDEPLSNLDKRLKEDMQIELRNIHEEFDKATIHVTHDQNEAFTLGDRIGIMNQGQLVQVGQPREVYHNPENQFIEEFLGDSNFLEGTVDTTREPTGVISDTGFQIVVPWLDSATNVDHGDRITVSLRPEVISVDWQDNFSDLIAEDNSVTIDDDGNQVAVASVQQPLYRGSVIRYYVDLAGEELFLERRVGNETTETPSTIEFRWKPDQLHCFDEKGERIE